MQAIEIEVAVIGGAAAGLAAALTLGRTGRQTVVFDTGRPRNKPAAYAQNFFTRDGTPPAELLRIGREQLAAYPSVQLKSAAVTSAAVAGQAFQLTTDAGEVFRAKRVIIATGVKDHLPPVKGMAELWGSKLFHCPYCHGWEIKDQPIALFANGEMAYEFARTLSNWHADILICTNGPATCTAEAVQQLARNGIVLEETPVEKIEEAHDGILITFTNGTAIRKTAAYVKADKLEFHHELAVQLGCALTEQGSIQIDATYETTVPGVFAAGDVSHPSFHQVSMAATSGHMAAAVCNNGLTKETFEGK